MEEEHVGERAWKGGPERVTAPYLKRAPTQAVPGVGRGRRSPVRNRRHHPPRLSTPGRPIAHKYREGKVKSTADSGVKQDLKPCARKRSEPHFVVTACLLHNEPTSRSSAARARAWRPAPGAKAGPKRAESRRRRTRNFAIYPRPG